MAPQEFGNLKTPGGVQKLNAYLASRSYISGYAPTQDDVETAEKLLGAPVARDCPHAFRWYKHITSFAPAEQATWPQGEKKEAPKKAQDDDIDLFGKSSLPVESRSRTDQTRFGRLGVSG